MAPLSCEKSDWHVSRSQGSRLVSLHLLPSASTDPTLFSTLLLQSHSDTMPRDRQAHDLKRPAEDALVCVHFPRITSSSSIDRAWRRATAPALHPLAVVLPCWQACKTLRRPRHRLPPSLHAEIQQIKNVRFIAYLNQSLVRAHACFTVSPCFQAGGQDDGISNGLKSSRTQTSASANFPTSQPSPAQKQSNSCRT